jgi:hypothetical protein
MVSYHGISQQQIINSIIEACEFVHSHSPGPICDGVIDKILADVPAMQSAKNDDDFSSALLKSDHLCRMRYLFEAYAIDDTGGIGREVLDDLNAWGAFNRFHTAENRPVDFEIAKFVNGVKKAHNQLRKFAIFADREQLETIEGILKPFAEKGEFNGSVFRGGYGSICFGAKNSAAQAVANAFPDNNVIDVDGSIVTPRANRPSPKATTAQQRPML